MPLHAPVMPRAKPPISLLMCSCKRLSKMARFPLTFPVFAELTNDATSDED